MTEKRFTIKGTWGKSLNRLKGVICDNNKDMYMTDVVCLLNELQEENEQLKEHLDDFCDFSLYVLDERNKENKQLKKELKKYIDAFDCSQCKFQNYDWFDDGDEFEVCEKGNNEAQMENHSCSEWEEIQ